MHRVLAGLCNDEPMAGTKRPSLDNIDRRLLDEMQRDNRRTLAELAEAANTSTSSARRRIDRMRSAGVIEADVSIVSPQVAGVEIIVHVMMQQESSASYANFRKRVLLADEVTQCYSVTGESDFILHVQMPDLSDYDTWIENFILADPDVRRCDSHVVYSRVKFTTAVRMDRG
jgi:Lrp/AsnC family leucine-responsive transcriptional regulator